MMASCMVTLVAVCLCFLVSVLHGQPLTLAVNPAPKLGSTGTITITAPTASTDITFPATVNITILDTSIATFTGDDVSPVSLVQTFNAGESPQWRYTGLKTGLATADVVLISASDLPNGGLSTTTTLKVQIAVTASLLNDIPSGSGTQGTLTISSLPASELTISLTSNPGGLTFTPSNFTFHADDASTSQYFTAFSVYSSTYDLDVAFSGPDADAGLVSTPPGRVNSTYVDQRNVYVSPSGSLNVLAGETSPPILVYLDIAPSQIDFAIDLIRSDTSFTLSVDTLEYGLGQYAASYTFNGTTPGDFYVTYMDGGFEKNYYDTPSPTSFTIILRTIVAPTATISLQTGIASSPQTIYVVDAPPDDLTVTFGGDGLTFDPPSVVFNPTTFVNSFTVTAQPSYVAGTPITYTITGTGSVSDWYNALPNTLVTLALAERTVTAVLPTTTVTLGEVYNGYLLLNDPTPTSFSVTITGDSIVFDPSVITFQGAAETTNVTFTYKVPQLGVVNPVTVRFTLGGDDASFVNPIPVQAITIVQRPAPTINFNSPITVGVISTGSINFGDFPITSNLTINITVAGSPDVTITPSIINLSTGDTVARFELVATSTDTFRLFVAFEGGDVALYPSDQALTISVDPVDVVVSSTPTPTLTAGVSYTSFITLSLNPSTSTLPVTVTPSGANDLFTFVPPSVTLTGADVACFTVIPLAKADASTVAFTLSSPYFTLPHPTLTLPPVILDTINVQPATVTVTVGVVSYPIIVSLPNPTTTSFTLTPVNPDLTFTPASLSFGPGITSQAFTITSSVVNGNTRITWLIDDDAPFNPPAFVSVSSIVGTISGPTSLAPVDIGRTSTPAVITVTPPPSRGLTITPLAPGLTFTPPSLIFSQSEPVGFFTAVQTSLEPQVFTIDLSVSGPDADWYNTPSSISFQTTTRLITITPPSSVTYGKLAVGHLNVSTPPDDSLIINVCGPNNVTTNPSPLVLNKGEYSLYYSLSVGANGPTTVTWSLSGPDANKYSVPAASALTIVAPQYSISATSLSTQYFVPSEVRFNIDDPNVPEDLSLTLTPVSDTYTFTPASVTFNSTSLIAMASAIPDKAGTGTVTYVLSGNHLDLFTPPSTQHITIDLDTLESDIVLVSAEYFLLIPEVEYLPLLPLNITIVVPPSLSASPSTISLYPYQAVPQFKVTVLDPVPPVYYSLFLTGPGASVFESDFSDPVYIPYVQQNVTFSTPSVTLYSDVSKSVVQVTLNSPPIHDLTVVPILPDGLTTSPSPITFGPGDTNFYFTFVASGVTTGSWTVYFELSGTDKDFFILPLSSINVNMQLGSISLEGGKWNSAGPQIVGYISLSYPAPNGLTLTPIAQGLDFYPPVLEFQKGEKYAEVVALSRIGGTSAEIQWILGGPDANFYGLPSPGDAIYEIAVFNAAVYLDPDCQASTAGVPYKCTLFVDWPVQNFLNVTLSSPCLSFSPSNFEFVPQTSSFPVTVTATKSCNLNPDYILPIDVVVSGLDSVNYANVIEVLPPISLNTIITRNTVNVLSGVPSGDVWVTLSVPGDVTITPSAPGCTFSPSALAFNGSTTDLAYTVTCSHGTPAYNGDRDEVGVYYAVSGPDASLYSYDLTKLATTITVSPIVITTPGTILTAAYATMSPLSIDVGIPVTPPAGPITLTPISPYFTFDPPSITFDGITFFSTFSAIPFPHYGDGTFTTPILWNVSGDSNGVTLSNAVTVLITTSGSFIVPTFETLKAGPNGALSFTIEAVPPPKTDVTLFIVAPGCTFDPSGLSFGPSTPIASSIVSCASRGSHLTSFSVNGTDALYYFVPDTRLIAADLGEITVTYNIPPGGARASYYPQPNVEYPLTISLNPPAVNGLTLTPSASGLTFDPPTITLSPGATVATAHVVATQITESVVGVYWTLSGPDASLYSNPTYDEESEYPDSPVTTVDVSFNYVTPPSDYTVNGGHLYVGATTPAYVITLDYPPSQKLIVTPYGAGLTFNPPSLEFYPGDTSREFTITVTLPSTGSTIYYTLDGPDAPFYLLASSSTVESSLLTLETITTAISGEDAYVGDPVTVVFYTGAPPPSPVTLTFLGDFVDFSVPTAQLTPLSYYASVTYTPLAAGDGSFIVNITGDGLTAFRQTWQLYQYTTVQRPFHLLSTFSDLYAGVPSALHSVAIQSAPPSDVVLVPHAPDVDFSPSNFSFDANTYHVEFRATARVPTAYNPTSVSESTPLTVSWSVAGTNADWYAIPASASFQVLPRDLNLVAPSLGASSDAVLLNVPQTITYTTTYPPSTGFTLTPNGPFIFTPPQLTFAANQSSASLTIQSPIVVDDFDVQFTLSGVDAGLYEAPTSYSVSAKKWHFVLPDLGEIVSRGTPAAPLVARTVAVPPANVTLTIVSDYLEFFPSTLTFGPTSPSASFTFGLRGLGRGTAASTFAVSYFVGGPAAYLFETPSPTTVQNSVVDQYQVWFFGDSLDQAELDVGVPYSASITLEYPPLGTLVVTPTATSPSVTISPASFTITRQSPLVATFTITATYPTDDTVYLNYALTGTDAVYYNELSAAFTVNKRQFSVPNPLIGDLIVGVPTQPISIGVPYPSTVDLYLFAPGITFTPNPLVFTPDVSTASFTANGSFANDVYLPISFVVSGQDAPLYDAPAQQSQFINTRTWAHIHPDNLVLTAGVPHIVSYSVRTAPNSYITITPTAAGVTFTPATLNISNPHTSGWFTVIGTAAGTSVQVTVSVGGPDAVYYDSFDGYSIKINYNSITVTIDGELPGSDSSVVQIGDVTAVTLSLESAAINGLYVAPAAHGLTFDPETVYFPPGVQYAHTTFTSNISPGPTQITFHVSGPDSTLFNNADPLHKHVTVDPLNLNINLDVDDGGQTLLVGGLSPTYPVFVSTAISQVPVNTPENFTVSFVVSPAGVADIFPPNFTITPSSPSGHFQIRPNILASTIYVQPILSGPGAVYFAPVAALAFSTTKRSFAIDDFTNYFAYPEARQFVVGQKAGPFGVTALSVPTDVALSLSAPGLQFIPSVLRFTGTFETLYFTVVPLEPIQTVVTFSVTGTDAHFFDAPPPSDLIRVTHAFVIPELPSVVVGRTSDPVTISVVNTLINPVTVTPTADNLVFNPPILLLTPNVTSVTFTYTGLFVNYNLGSNINPLIIGSHTRYTSDDEISSNTVVWNIREAGEYASYQLSVPQLQGTVGVNVVPATFRVAYSSLTIGSVGSVNITVTAPPRSDVVLTLVANNLNFDPPSVTFTPSNTSQLIAVRPVHADYKDSSNIPFTVDYIISGTNYIDYIPPAQTFLGVSQGSGAKVGAYLGGAGVVTASWVVIFAFIAALLL